MSNEQKPSAEALKTFDFDDDGEFGPFTYGGQFVLHFDVLELLARVRREARAEAFDEAASESERCAACAGVGECCAQEYRQLASHYRDLAAKERAS